MAARLVPHESWFSKNCITLVALTVSFINAFELIEMLCSVMLIVERLAAIDALFFIRL